MLIKKHLRLKILSDCGFRRIKILFILQDLCVIRVNPFKRFVIHELHPRGSAVIAFLKGQSHEILLDWIGMLVKDGEIEQLDYC